jgi:hypothetical protein
MHYQSEAAWHVLVAAANNLGISVQCESTAAYYCDGEINIPKSYRKNRVLALAHELGHAMQDEFDTRYRKMNDMDPKFRALQFANEWNAWKRGFDKMTELGIKLDDRAIKFMDKYLFSYWG